MGRRLTRKALKQDEFVSIVDRMMRWGKSNWQPLVIGVGVVVGVAVIIGLVGMISGNRRDNAAEALQRAMDKYEESTAPDAGPEVAEEARSLFEEVADDFGGLPQGRVAKLYTARLLMERGDADEARELLVKLSRRRKGDPVVRVATLDLIQLRVQSGQGAEVAAELEAMVAGRDPRLPRDVALFELANVYVHERDFAKAEEYFQKLVDDFPESPYSRRARQKLQELG
jgi:predicted negative regulator of RcsB-dependent stress response